jgi:hypothetical protein
MVRLLGVPGLLGTAANAQKKVLAFQQAMKYTIIFASYTITFYKKKKKKGGFQLKEWFSGTSISI